MIESSSVINDKINDTAIQDGARGACQCQTVAKWIYLWTDEYRIVGDHLCANNHWFSLAQRAQRASRLPSAHAVNVLAIFIATGRPPMSNASPTQQFFKAVDNSGTMNDIDDQHSEVSEEEEECRVCRGPAEEG